MANGEPGQAPPQDRGIYVCDFAGGLEEWELRELFDHYGAVVSLERIDRDRTDDEEAIAVEYSLEAEAEEAQDILNYSSVRGKTCRCMFARTVEAIQRTATAGHRLVVECLDPQIDSCGLRGVCRLLGPVLDCKVELDSGGHSRGFGFVHYTRLEGAKKAMTFMDGMQIGETMVRLRPFEIADIGLFTGCLYETLGSGMSAEGVDENSESPASASNGGKHLRVNRGLGQQVRGHTQSLEYHLVEVASSIEEKLHRLKELLELYDPSHDRQILIIASTGNMAVVRELLGTVCESSDFDSVDLAIPGKDRMCVLNNYDIGNTYVLAMSSDASTHREVALVRPASVLINFDFPETLLLYFCRLLKVADLRTRVHSFLSPINDNSLAMPLMSCLEEAGHDIPPALVELWARRDPKSLESWQNWQNARKEEEEEQ